MHKKVKDEISKMSKDELKIAMVKLITEDISEILKSGTHDEIEKTLKDVVKNYNNNLEE